MIGKAFAREVGDLIRYDAKVTQIQQDDERRHRHLCGSRKMPAAPLQAKADWCVCTIPLSILSQIAINVGAPMKAAIDAVPYASSVKIGLQFKRRFWEEDEAIYGGISYTDLPIRQIGYPKHRLQRSGKGVLLGAYLFGRQCLRVHLAGAGRAGRAGGRIRRQTPPAIQDRVRERRRRRLAPGAVHARLRRRLDRRGAASSTTRISCAIDGRIVLAGEHASYHPGLAGGRGAVGARRHRAAAPARGEDVMNAGRTNHHRHGRASCLSRPSTSFLSSFGSIGSVSRFALCSACAERGALQSRLPVHRAERPGIIRQCLSGLPHAGRQGRGRPAVPRFRCAALAPRTS